MTQAEVLDIYQKTGALLSGHFLLSSGLHSDRYLQSALVLQQPDIATKLCAALAKPFRDQRIEAVIAPALGGVFVSHETARALGVRALFAERVNGVLTLRRGFSIKQGRAGAGGGGCHHDREIHQGDDRGGKAGGRCCRCGSIPHRPFRRQSRSRRAVTGPW